MNQSIQKNNWELKYSDMKAGEFEFSVDNELFLKLNPVNFGSINEGMGLLKRNREHCYIDDDNAARLEMKSSLPFGAEPKVERDVEFIANHAIVSTKLELKSDFPIKKLEVDNLSIPLIWDEFAIVAETQTQNLEKIEWQKIKKEDGDILFSLEESPIMFLLKNDKQILEIGLGDNIWRWKMAKNIKVNSNFKAEIKNNKIELSRGVCEFEEPTVLDVKNLRFKWYFSWNSIKEIAEFAKPPCPLPLLGDKFKIENNNEIIYKLENEKWNESAKSAMNDNQTDTLCFKSNPVTKQLKKLVRTVASNHSNKKIIIVTEPHFCNNSSHVDRPKKKSLIHWDILEMFDFYFWANRQLNKTDNKLVFSSELNSIWKDIPSMNGML